MTRHARRFTSLTITALLLTLLSAGGCSHIGEAIDCKQMCEQLETCIDGDLDVEHCAERCEDEADENYFAHRLDDCTDCLDRNYSCAEVPEECSVCHEVSQTLLD